MCCFCWKWRFWYRKCKFCVACREYRFYVCEKFSETKRRETVIIFDYCARAESISECFAWYVRKCFFWWEISIKRQDIIDSFVGHNRYTALSIELPLNNSICFIGWYDFSCICAQRCEFACIATIESHKYRGSSIHRCNTRKKYLHWRCFWARYNDLCRLWYENVGYREEEYSEIQRRSKHRLFALQLLFSV